MGITNKSKTSQGKKAKATKKKSAKTTAKKNRSKATKKRTKKTSKKATKSPKKVGKAATTQRTKSQTKKNKPLRKDPDLEIDREVLAFIAALDEYKKKNNRLFPSNSEILQVLKDMGYRKI